MWLHKARTLLVVLSVALGVAGMGMIGRSKLILLQGMNDSYEDSSPSHMTFLTESFDRELLGMIRREAGVKAAEARRNLYGRLHPDTGLEGEPAGTGWTELQLFASDDFPGLRMERVYPVQGLWPPPEGEIVLERSAMEVAGLHTGERVWVDFGGGTIHRLRIAGAVRDPIRDTAAVAGRAYGYVAADTLRDLGLSGSYNLLSLKVDREEHSIRHLNDTAVRIRDVLQRHGVNVLSLDIPPPGRHWAYDLVASMGLILQGFGGLVLLLGTTLIVNTVSATTLGQLRQIGVMKVMGADTMALLRMYLGSMALIGILALLAGIPLGWGASMIITDHAVRLMGFEQTPGMPLEVLLQQAAVGLLLPLLAAAAPVLWAVRLPERSAIGGTTAGTSPGRSGTRWVWDGLPFLSRPLLLSLRGTFRRKGRLALTVLTLGIGGAAVLSVFSVRASLERTLEDAAGFTNYDARISFSSVQPGEEAERLALGTPGVREAESWYSRMAVRQRPDGTRSQDLSLYAVPPGSPFLIPHMSAGRWLGSGGEDDIVLNSYLLRRETDVRIGSQIRLEVGGQVKSWRVVGFAAAPAEVDAYVSYGPFTSWLGADGRAGMLQLRTEAGDRDAAAQAAAEVKTRLSAAGMKVNAPSLTADVREAERSRYGIVTVFLSMMALMLVLVAGLGLTGTLSLSTLERTREFGIMRSIGASDGAVRRMVAGEGLVIGGLGFAVSAVLGPPVSRRISDGVGRALFEAPLHYVFPLEGVVYWLCAVLVLSWLAGVWPAWKASRLPVKDVLNYE
ncbi:FtsX-like permease family protein [Paenibacillus sp. S-38]|uniref:ABC transporter permease n=1 Tax=Paenibacillus sp. S-38 TaxID=3416710 RepID=UPI003CF529A5